jgi:hypothetical protein
VKRNPWQIDWVGVGLHQHREMDWQVMNLVMRHGPRPDQVQTTELIHDGSSDLHPQKGIGVTDGAARPHLVRTVTAGEAEVADASTRGQRWAALTRQPAGRRHAP